MMITSQQEASVVDGIDEEEGAPLPGFRFHPTDEELISFYLKRKVEKKPLSIEIIRQIDLYKYDPWDLAKVGSVVGEKEWYFYCKRGRKYKNSLRPNRVTGSGGFWKATGIDRPIFDSKCIIGLKKSLVYYRGSAGKGTKTEWMMHEFRLPQQPLPGAPSNHPNSQLPQAEIWTLCRIFKRNRKYIPADRRDQLSSKRVAITNNSPESNTMKEHYISFAKPSTQLLQHHHQHQQQQVLHYDDHECINAFGNHGMELVRRQSEEKIIESKGKVYSNANRNNYYDIKEQRATSPLTTPMELASNFSSPLHPSTSADQLDQGDDQGYGANYWWEDAIREIYS